MAFAALDRRAGVEARGIALRTARRVLDVLYLGSGYVAAACMVTILLITLTQIVTRYMGISVRGLSDYAGYFMAASAFLAFPLALNRGAHVRVEMALAAFGRYRHVGETAAFGVSAVIATWFAYYACRMVYWSWQFGDISTGLDATPLWIPQCTMAIGATLFAIAIIDQFVQLVLTGAHSIVRSSGLE